MTATFIHNQHGLLRSEDGEHYESWRGGTYPLGDGRSATHDEVSAALRNSRDYGPGQQATMYRWYAEWYIAHATPVPA